MADLPDTVTASTLADLLGLSSNRVHKLAAEGVVQKAARGRYLLRESVAAYITYARDNPGGRRLKDPEQADEKRRLTKAQADMAELKLAQGRDELVQVEDVRREWRGLALDLRARLLAIAPRVAAAVGLDRTAAATLDSEIRHALEDIADDH